MLPPETVLMFNLASGYGAGVFAALTQRVRDGVGGIATEF